MSRSKRIFRLIQPQLPGSSLCGDILVVGRTDYILRGFLLDTTSQKDRMTLWKVVVPLFRPLSHLMLNYSNKIANRYQGCVPIDTKAYSQSAAIVFDEIREHVDVLKRLSRPADLLGHIAHQRDNPNLQVQFDFGITHYLIGNEKESAAIFQALVAEMNADARQFRDRLGPLVEFVLLHLESNPRGLIIAIDAWRLHNIELFNLEASCHPRPGLALV